MTISEKAAEKAVTILTSEGKKDWGLKIYVAGESCCGPAYGINVQQDQLPNDQVIEKNGLKVFVDKDLMDGLSGMELDYYSDDEREGFIFTGGKMSCGTDSGSGSGSGCGSSSGCNSCG